MANSIDEVITQLTAIIDQSRKSGSRLGYFASLYRRVTMRVKDGIAQNRFQDGNRMELLDVLFANRYLTAFEQHQNNQPTTSCWAVAFEMATQWRPLILQHLFLGINAHINLDLGIAAQLTSPGEKLLSLHADFEMINTILSELLQPVESGIGTVSPWIGLLDKINPRNEDAFINFSMHIARDSAWQFALQLNSLGPDEQTIAIQKRDQEIAALAHKVAQPNGALINAGLLMIRLRESSNVSAVMDVLN